MKRILTIAFALTLLASSAFAEDYRWTISASTTDPLVNTGSPVPGFVDYYLWLECTSTLGGAASADMGIVVNTLFYSSFTPQPGVLNFGAGQNLVLGLGGCPDAPFMAGTIAVADFSGAGGNLCLGNNSETGNNVTVDCDPVVPVTHANAYVGFASDGSTPCDFGTCLVSVESDSWGSIKGLYR